jgi:putative two-component system response regulator
MNDDPLQSALLESRILFVAPESGHRGDLVDAFERSGYRRLEVRDSGEGIPELVHGAEGADDPYRLLLFDLAVSDGAGEGDVYSRLTRSDAIEVPIILLAETEDPAFRREALNQLAVEEVFVLPMASDLLVLRCEKILTRQLYLRRIGESNRHNQRLFLNMLKVMAKVLETKDPYTKFHSDNVSKYARQLARRIGFEQERVDLLQIAGILHDFGKIGISDLILNKPGGLSGDEYDIVKRHPLIGSTILEPLQELQQVIRDVRHHHERFDGSGYPLGLAGGEIPLGARILCVADSYDAMTSNRAYHRSMSDEQSREELRRCAGTQFDPDIVKIMLELLDEHATSS